ncbi:LysR substrate-binding domain-containing protein [Roseicyclus sp.]|uniref:LysR substrate-binding domain-containing protein n=1 Tax=Roseicyclus sp. TaxID=1914329 RepID=UPI003FA16C60
MEAATHLKSLQALDMALRTGSLKDAADALGITPAAVGQRIRSLESYLGVDLLMRGRSGLRPTPELERALPDLQAAFAALDRVTRDLDFQRVAEIHIVAEPDWAELWLAPRLARFRAEHPNILFNVNGEGDVRLRIGASDLKVGRDVAGGEALHADRFVAVCTQENIDRLARHPAHAPLEGYPLLELERRGGVAVAPAWGDWFERFGMRDSGLDRAYRYRSFRTLLEAARSGVGMALAPLSLCLGALAEGELHLAFRDAWLPAPGSWRLEVRERARDRPQMRRFLSWLAAEAAETDRAMAALQAP